MEINCEALGRTDRDRRLADQHVAIGKVRQRSGEGSIDIGQIGGELPALLRGAHAHEVHPGTLDLCDVGREA